VLLALHNAIVSLLDTSLPALFTGTGAVQVSFGVDNWSFDPLSVDPVAGEPGPQDAVDLLPFDPTAPQGPYTLTRPPYPGPRRVYLRSAAGDLVAVSESELSWSSTAPSFTFQPRPGRGLTGFNQLEILYGIVAAGSSLKLLHQGSLILGAADEAGATQALSLVIAAVALSRDTLRQQAAFNYNSGSFQTAGILKTLSFAGGTAIGSTATLNFTAEVDLAVQRLLGDTEGKPIEHIVSEGRTVGTKRVDIDPIVQA
jgi:hypothetical protein